MKNNYITYNPNKNLNIIIVVSSIVVFIFVIFVASAGFFIEKWEDSRLNSVNNDYSEIPVLDKNGLSYFVEIKNKGAKQTIIPQPTAESVPPVDDIKNIAR